MERKNQLFMQFLEVSEEVRPGKRRKDKKHTDSNKEHNCDEHHRKNHKHRKDRMSPAARNILILLLKEECMNQRSIAISLGITAQAVSETIKKLEYHEMIIKEQGKLNNENIITLTTKGRERATEIQQDIDDTVACIFKDFSEEELTIFESLLEKIQINKNNESSKDELS